MSFRSSVKIVLQNYRPKISQWIRWVYGVYEKIHIKYLLGRIIYLCDLLLADMYRFPSPVVRNIARWLARHIGDSCAWVRTFPRIPVYKLIGPDYTIAFIGSASSKRELRQLFFDETIEEQQLGKIALWGLSKRIRDWLRQDVDMVIYEHPRRIYPHRFKPAIMFTVPTWVDQTISLPESPKELIPGKRKRTYINRCIKESYVNKFSQSENDFDHFYHEIYLPYVTVRYGGRLLETPYDQMKRLFRRGGLLLVTLNGETVAGNLFYIRNETFFKNDFGLLLEGSKSWKQGASTVLDWFCILWAYEQGIKTFNMGGTRGWQSDGVFWYKSNWRAKVARRSRIYKQWTFMARLLSQSLQDRINEVGFISEINERFYGVHLSDESDALKGT